MTARIPTTRSTVVYEQLREDILRGMLPPGARLRSVELATRFSVSQGVLREALTRLAEQGLVVSAPQQGFRVRSINLTDLHELTEARIDVESLILRKAIARGDIQWESSVIAAHHTLASTNLTTDSGQVNDAWDAAHEAFHRSLLQGCGNERLLTVAASLRDAASLYRLWSQAVGDDDRDAGQEHRQILDAVLARDEPDAACLLAQHIQRTTDTLLMTAAQSPAEIATTD